jgi:death on curing protein
MAVVFPTLDEVLRLQRIQIDQFGGSHGLRDPGLLESALAQPEAMFGGHYAHDGLAAMAGAYLFHIAKNHAFVDGNKRIAAATALLFLGLNHARYDIGPAEYADMTLRVASGESGKDDAIQFFKDRIG